MSFLGTMSPPSSSLDSMDITMLSPVSVQIGSPQQMCYSSAPYLTIKEQPVEKFRFRYKSEMNGTHGSLTGLNSNKSRKSTYPTVQLHNFTGPAIIRCALYQIKNGEPHPHRLVVRVDNKDEERDDPHDMPVSDDNKHTAVFHGMGIIHTAKKNIVSELLHKKKIYFKEGLARKGFKRDFTKQEEAELRNSAEKEAKHINLNIVRLGFQAFYEKDGILFPLCDPVYSNAVNNLKSPLTGELKIVRLDHTTVSCTGGQEIFVLVEKVVKNNIKIRFFECDEDDNEIWHDYGRFSPIDVHHQYAIVFKAPPYRDQNIEDVVKVCMELVRSSDGARSEPIIFKYKPSEKIGRKRVRYNDSFSSSELPVTINSLELSTSLSENLNMTDIFKNMDTVLSSDLDRAYDQLFPGYSNLFDDQNLNIDGNSTPTSTPRDTNSEQNILAPKIIEELTALFKRPNLNKDTDYVERKVKTFFYEIRTQDGNNALHSAIICEQFQELQYILVILNRMKHLKIVDLKNKAKETALHLAVKINNLNIVQLLLSVGADPNCVNNDGNTPLHCAIDSESWKLYSLLATPEIVNMENYDGYTPLHLAILKTNLECVQFLISQKADVNKKHSKSGDTPLHFAIRDQCVNIVEYLLNDTEAKVDEENFKRETPLFYARIFAESTTCEAAAEILKKLQLYVEKHGFLEVSIKTELEEDDDISEEEMIIKSEPSSPEPGTSMIIDETSSEYIPFGTEVIEKLSTVLNNSPALNHLCELVGFPSGGMALNTKMLLNFTNIHEIPVERVRNILKKYGATEAVTIIDEYY